MSLLQGLLGLACAAPSTPVRIEDWVQVGTDLRAEAEAVEATLVSGGFVVVARAAAASYVALGFERADGRRAVRVITTRGVVASLDSHEPDGVVERHGAVRLIERAGPDDLDGDGRPEVLLARDPGAGGPPCLAILRVEADGSASLVPTDADRLQGGACVAELVDVDGDGVFEARVPLSWPGLGLGEAAPAIDALLVVSDGAWRADGLPPAHDRAETGRRETALAAARARLDVSEAARIGVELAALAHLRGAAIGAQVERFDGALSGMVLRARERDAIDRIRAVIAAGWRE